MIASIKPRLGVFASICLPLFILGIIVSIRSHWRSSDSFVNFRSSAFHLTADEAGFYLAQYPVLRPWSMPRIPKTNSLPARIRFSYHRTTVGPLSTRLLHIPYWPFWLIVTPPIVGWLVNEGQRRLRATRTSQNLCAQCGYDLRATRERCPECGTASHDVYSPTA